MIQRLFSVLVGGIALLAMQAGDEVQAQAQPKVAVSEFTEPVYDSPELAGKNLARDLKESIRTAIINTKKFTVISRDFTTAEKEAQLRGAGRTTRGASGSKAKFEAIDFAIEGSITSAQLTIKKDGFGGFVDKMFLGGEGMAGSCTSGIFSVSINVNIISLATGETRYAEKLTKSLESDCSRSGGAVDFPVVMSVLADELAFAFSTNIYPLKAIDAQPDGTFVLNYGDNFVPIGTTLRITTPSQEIQSDGATLKRVGAPLGRACVVEANSDTAVARMIGATSATVPVGSVAQIEALPTYDKKKKKWNLCKV